MTKQVNLIPENLVTCLQRNNEGAVSVEILGDPIPIADESTSVLAPMQVRTLSKTGVRVRVRVNLRPPITTRHVCPERDDIGLDSCKKLFIVSGHGE